MPHVSATYILNIRAGADGYEENRDSASYQYAAAIRVRH